MSRGPEVLDRSHREGRSLSHSIPLSDTSDFDQANEVGWRFTCGKTAAGDVPLMPRPLRPALWSS